MAHILPLSDDLALEITQLQKQAAGFFKINLEDKPTKIVERVKECIEDTKDSEKNLDDDQLAGLAVILGEQYVRQFNWHWGEINFHEDGLDENYAAGVLIEDNSLAIVPVWWISDILEGDASNGVLLNFNLVAANSVPVADPGSALMIH